MSLVSIAICTYNGEKYLREQLDSICNQTYPNLEIVVYDDVSNDSTIEILDEYAHKDSRIKVHQNEKNLGFVGNFSQAISACTGDYIALADQDDIWKLDKIEKFLAEIGDNILIYSDAILIDKQGNPTGKQLVRPHHNLVRGKCNKAFFLYNCVSGNTMMFKKELVPYILPIPDVSFHDIWIAYVASTVGEITFTEESLTYYRRHNEQFTKDKQKQRAKGWLQRIKRKTELKKRGTKTALRNYIAYRNFLNIVNDPTTAYILDVMINFAQNFESIFIDSVLRNILLSYQNEIFAILPEASRTIQAKRAARGLKFFQLTLFT